MNSLVVSRQRVIDHGEVYTRPGEINAMLDLVKHETERIESRFLEPACGTGNFLAEVLSRKLRVVEDRYRRDQLGFERNAILAVTSIYGIDILADNVARCRERLLELFDSAYTRLFRADAQEACRAAVHYILSQNIVHGDALTLQTVGEDARPIVFPEWSPVNGSMFKRRDFTFDELMGNGAMRATPLFSDLGEEAFLPTPVREYPLVHYLKVVESQDF